MNDQLDALERLARMRADGILTDAEFQAEKTKLLATKKAGGRAKTLAEGWDQSRETRRSVRSLMKWVWIALLVGFPLFVGIAWWQLNRMTPQEAAQAVAKGLPLCASQEVRDTLRGAIEKGPASNLIAMRVLEIAHVEERGVGGTPMKRYCAADVATNGGAEHIGYTVRYSNEDTDSFIIETGDDTGPPPPSKEAASAPQPAQAVRSMYDPASGFICFDDTGKQMPACNGTAAAAIDPATGVKKDLCPFGSNPDGTPWYADERDCVD